MLILPNNFCKPHRLYQLTVWGGGDDDTKNTILAMPEYR